MKVRILLLATLSIAALTAEAADASKGEKLAQAQCAACHGKDFVSPVDPSYPKLAGQYVDYLEKALREYQSGGRKNPIMRHRATPVGSVQGAASSSEKRADVRRTQSRYSS